MISKRCKRVVLILSLIFFLSSINDLTAKTKLSNQDALIFKTLKAELKRSMKELKKNGSITPYFISYTVKDQDMYTVSGSYGAFYGEAPIKYKKVIIEIRVGDYDYDNTDVNNLYGRHVSKAISWDGDVKSLKRDLWYQTNAAYEYTLQLYYYKKQKSANQFKKEKKIPSFSKEKAYRYYDDSEPYVFNRNEIKDFVIKASNIFRNYPEIQYDHTAAKYGSEKIYYVNSEGSEQFHINSIMDIGTEVKTQADDGTELKNYGGVYFNLKFEKTDLKKAYEKVEQIAKELIALKKAPKISPETGPAILSPQATGVLFHEAIGHRLEGERQESENEGHTFKESIGKKIIPEFLSVYDDPTLKEFNGTYLNGYYKYDDQGIPGKRVELIRNGVLKNFLLSRTPIEGFSKSNGHGRRSDDFRSMARMSTTLVKSKKQIPQKELKEKLIAECKKQKKNHAFVIDSMMGGETLTSIGNFQVYKSVPQLVYRIDCKTGSQELVRGVEIVGTPLTSVNKIMITGDDYEVKNAYCGAESGYVRSSIIAPSAIISEIELQNKKLIKRQLPLISRPSSN